MDAPTLHPDFIANLPAWQRARDVLAGEDAVKAAGPKYLPRLDSQSDGEYAAYKTRACFFGATARTLGEYLDLIFRRTPNITLVGTTSTSSPITDPLNSSTPQPLNGFLANCDLWGTDFLRYARTIVSEILSVGRAGSLVTLESGRPVLTMFRAEQILDWSVTRQSGCETKTPA